MEIIFLIKLGTIVMCPCKHVEKKFTIQRNFIKESYPFQ